MAHAVRPRDLLLLLALGGIWGTAFTFIRIGLDSFSPVLFAAIRFDIVALILLGIAALRGKGSLVPRGRRQWTAVAIASFFNVALYHAFLFWGQQFTAPAIAAVIVGLNPIITTVFSRALLSDDRVGIPGVVGLVLGFLGILLLATLKGGSLLDAQGLGELAVIVAVASWAIGSVLVKRSAHGMDVYAFIGWHSLGGALILHAASLALEPGARMVFDRDGVLALLYVAVVSSGLGFVIYFTLIEHIGPIRVNLVSHIAPVFAALTSIVMLQTGIELRALFAFVLIASGFALVTRPAPPKTVPGKSTPPEP